MPWYKDWFNTDAYDLVYRNRNEAEALRLVELILDTCRPNPGARVLDVGCGRGRHAMAFAERGFDVTGVDLAQRALEIARKSAADRGLSIHFEQGDMRDVHAPAAFDLVVNLFTAFGYFTEHEEHLRVVSALRSAAKPGAWVVQDFMNADLVRRTFIPEDERTIGDVHVHQKRHVEPGNGAFDRICKQITLTRNGDAHTFNESVALIALDDFRGLYEEAGLTLEHVFGSYDGAPFGPDSPRLILFSRS
ncbi:MAG: class I SAM-dependent methyltransferase [Rhodothermales bacterium]